MGSRFNFHGLLFVAGLAAVLFAAGCSEDPLAQNNVVQKPAQAAPRVPADEPVAQVASEVSPSVVQINFDVTQNTPFGPQSGEGVGSGVIYRNDGYIITNNHIVEGASNLTVAFERV